MKKFDENNYEFNASSKNGIYLIHGFSSTTYEMKKLGEFLATKGYHIVINNLPGHGTTIEDCNKTTFNQWLDFSKQEFAKLCSKSDTTYIIGCSMGGAIALYLASIFPTNGVIVGGTYLKLSFYNKYINPILCYFIKIREKKLTYPKAIRDSISWYGYDAYPLIAYNELKKLCIFVRNNLHQLTKPSLIIHSKSDRMSSRDNVDIIINNIQSETKEVFEVNHAHHNLFDTNKDTHIIFEKIYVFIKNNI